VTVGVIGAKGRSDVTGWYAARKLSQSASVCAWGQGSVAEAKFGGRSSDGSSGGRGRGRAVGECGHCG
jgi:hypothetical protein